MFNKFFLVSFNNTFQTTEQVKEASPYGIAAAIAGAQLFAVFMFHIQYLRDHISPTLNALGWLSIKEHLLHRDALLTFKCMNDKAPQYLCDNFEQ